MKRKTQTVCVLLAVFVFLSGCLPAEPALKNQPIQLIVPGAPGGGWDALARSIQTVAEKEKLVPEGIRIVYEEGEGGSKGWARLQSAGAASAAMMSSLLITNELLGYSSQRYTEFTPLALMASEWQTVIVKRNSAIQSTGELLHKLRQEPALYPVGIEPQFGNDDQLAFAEAARTAGVPLASIRFFRYKNGHDLLAALQKGEIAAASLSSSQSEFFSSQGAVRVIAISSPERVDYMPDVPTWTEQGVPVVFPHWRGVMAPGNLSRREKQEWEAFLAAVHASPYWKEELEKKHWTSFYRNSRDTELLLGAETKKYRYLMNQK